MAHAVDVEEDDDAVGHTQLALVATIVRPMNVHMNEDPEDLKLRHTQRRKMTTIQQRREENDDNIFARRLRRLRCGEGQS
jgi:hypothetical protein